MSMVKLTAPGMLALSGAVDVDTVSELEQSGLNLMDRQRSAEWVVNWSAVTRADSAALAMMLSWVRDGGAKKVRLVFSDLPHELKALAGVCGVDRLLPMA